MDIVANAVRVEVCIGCTVKSIKIVLQWLRAGESPLTDAKIKGTSAVDLLSSVAATTGINGMTVPLQRGSMAMLQPPRSRFMITDILGGGGGGGGGVDSDERSPSPQGPRDLSVGQAGRHMHHAMHHQLQHHDDSDSDSSGQLDDQSICSNGEFDDFTFFC